MYACVRACLLRPAMQSEIRPELPCPKASERSQLHVAASTASSSGTAGQACLTTKALTQALDLAYFAHLCTLWPCFQHTGPKWSNAAPSRCPEAHLQLPWQLPQPVEDGCKGRILLYPLNTSLREKEHTNILVDNNKQSSNGTCYSTFLFRLLFMYTHVNDARECV